MHTRIVNLTAHPITLEGSAGTVTLASAGVVRAEEQHDDAGSIEVTGCGELPLVEVRYGAPVGLPDPEPGTLFIVSTIAAQAIRTHFPERHDVVTLVDAVRSADGRIIAARALALLQR